MSQLVVQKFGGTSVANLDRIQTVADRVAKQKAKGDRVVVVVSAMAGETDRLLSLGKSIGLHHSMRELDALVSTGEQVTATLLSLSLSSKNVGSISLLADQIPIRTNSEFGNAQIQFVAPQRVRRHLDEGRVVVVPGFQGVNDQGDITTLGRGGSDLTAVALAAALEADRCEIYTDVAGVFTADPNICPDARLISKMAYDEMLELASLGAKVLQARSVQLAKRYHIPVQVLSTFDLEGPGTLITKEDSDMEATVVSAITCDKKEAQISVRRLPDPIHAAKNLFGALSDAKIMVDVIVQDRNREGLTNITFTVPRDQFAQAKKIAEQMIASTRDAELNAHERIAKVSAVGLGMRAHSGVAAQMFRSLAREEIEILAVSTSDIKISCVVDDKYAELAVRALHDEFGLAKEPN